MGGFARGFAWQRRHHGVDLLFPGAQSALDLCIALGDASQIEIVQFQSLAQGKENEPIFRRLEKAI
jgi:hypothetical protein